MTEITQADRDAAAAIVYEENKDGLKWASAKGMRDHVAAGKWDWHPTVQAFARHREQAERETVAKIVAWLRNRKEMTERYIDYIETAQAADAIEAGEWK